MTPLERLLAATERLVDDVATVVVSHHDLHCSDPTGPAVTAKAAGPDPIDLTGLAKVATEVFAVGTSTRCVPADTGTKGEVAVQVPVATFPLPLASCRAMAIVPGQLPGTPATQVTCPSHVPSGDDVVNVAVSATQAPGLYIGHLGDQSGNMKRPFLIFLDGLT